MHLINHKPELLEEDLTSIANDVASFINRFRRKHIFITGGTGFIGRCILDSLLYLDQRYQLNARFFVLSRFPSNLMSESPYLFKFNNLELIKGDIRDFHPPKSDLHYIIHCAATPSLSLNKEKPLEMFGILADGTRHLLDVARSTNAERVLVLSSSYVYGTDQIYETKLTENSTISPVPYNALGAYTEGKRTSEFLCAVYASQYQMNIPVARCFHQIGPHIPLFSGNAIGDFINKVLQEKDIVLESDGSQVRSYLYYSDFVVWLLKILVDGNNCAYNVGSEIRMSLNQIVDNIADQYQIKVHYNSSRSNTIKNGVIPDTSLARDSLGLVEKIRFEAAFAKTLKWYRKAKSNT